MRHINLSAATVRGKQVQLQPLFASQLATLVYTHGMVAHDERRGLSFGNDLLEGGERRQAECRQQYCSIECRQQYS